MRPPRREWAATALGMAGDFGVDRELDGGTTTAACRFAKPETMRTLSLAERTPGALGLQGRFMVEDYDELVSPSVRWVVPIGPPDLDLRGSGVPE